MTESRIWKSAKYEQVEQAMGHDLGQWMAIERGGHTATSWLRMSRLVWSLTGIEVSHETLRAWWLLWMTYTDSKEEL